MKMTESISELSKSLGEFNKNIKAIEKNATNPFFKNKYATLDIILDTVRPLLADCGISLMFIPQSYEDGEFGIKVMLLHTSGQYITFPETRMKPTKQGAQEVASLWTYLKRYSVSAVLGLSVGDPDDDGDNCSSEITGEINRNEPKYIATTKKSGLSEAQIKRLYGIAYSKGYKREQVQQHVKSKYSIDVADMTREQYDAMCKGYEDLV